MGLPVCVSAECARADVIGGVFGIATESSVVDAVVPPFLNEAVAFVNARSAIAFVVGSLPRKAIVWLPSYLCDSVVETVRGTGKAPRFYPVSGKLSVEDTDWVRLLEPGDLVLLVDYFGWRPQPELIGIIHAAGALVLEDAASALLTEGVGDGADWVVYSPRKFLGVPDGGILHGAQLDRDREIGWLEVPAVWWEDAHAAVALRAASDADSEVRPWFRHFQAAEATAPTGPYPMSQLSRRLLRHAFDYEAIIRRRRQNYGRLLEAFREIAVRPELPLGVAPLGFPIRVRDRDRVRKELFSRRIYPPVHWPIRHCVPAEFTDSHELAAEVMTLPCDQRYGATDMDCVVDALGGALGW